MRDALNKSGRPIYFSITEGVPWTDGHAAMHCYGNSVFTVFPWISQGLDPRALANSYLVEYCNNEDTFGSTDAAQGPGGFLSNLDSQQLLTWDNLTVPGAFNDNDMLEVCNGGQSVSEYRAQFSTWAILASPLILGNDPRSMTADCLAIIANTEVIAIDQDPLVVRGSLVQQWPQAVWPNVSAAAAQRVAPLPTAQLAMASCDSAAPTQSFSFNATDGTIRTPDGQCLTYGGYHESNFAVTACAGWSVPGIGSQLWAPNASDGSLHVVDNLEKVADVFDCDLTAPGSVQVCTQAGADCYSTPGGPPGCGLTGQQWRWSWGAAGAALASSVGGFSHCVAVVPLPAPKVDIRLQIWAKPLANADVAVLAFNRSPSPIRANISWADVGLAPGRAAKLRDLWAHADLGQATDWYNVTVQPHDVIMLRATPV